MLILTRKAEESVDIYFPHEDGRVHKASVTVLRSKHPGQVRLGFDADQDVHFLRREVKDDGRTSYSAKGGSEE